MPADVVTAILPVVAFEGTVAWICVAEATVYDAMAPLKVTLVAPAKFVPLIVTVVPGAPDAGDIELIVGPLGAALGTVKSLVLCAVPPGVVTAILPEVAFVGTEVRICVLETTLNTAAVPLNVTLVAPLRFVPVTVTVVPDAPELGENAEIVGIAPVTVNELGLVALPDGVVTVMAPLVAPDGTDAWICVDETTLKTAAAPLNATEVAPPRFEPVIVTVAPGPPDVGENDVIEGGVPVTVKSDALCALPLGVVTPSFPLVAPDGTDAWICVDETTL
jgi:hypothetical protein